MYTADVTNIKQKQNSNKNSTLAGQHHYREQDGQCMNKVNIKARSRNPCCRGKSVSNKYSVCVRILYLVIRHIILPSVDFLVCTICIYIIS